MHLTDEPPTHDELRMLAWMWGSLRPDDLWWVSTEDGYDCLPGSHPAVAPQYVERHPRLPALWIYAPRTGALTNEIADNSGRARFSWSTPWKQVPTWTVELPVMGLCEAVKEAEKPVGRFRAPLFVKDRTRAGRAARRWLVALIEADDSNERDDLDYCLHRWLMHVRTETLCGRYDRVRPFRGFWPRLAPIVRARREQGEK